MVPINLGMSKERTGAALNFMTTSVSARYLQVVWFRESTHPE